MRKTIFTMLVLALSSIALQARPVDQATASRLGQSFVKANFEFTRQSDQLNLVQTAYWFLKTVFLMVMSLHVST